MSDGSHTPESTQLDKSLIRDFSRSTPEGRAARRATATRILEERRNAREHQLQVKNSSQQEGEYLQNRLEKAAAEGIKIENEKLALKAKLAHLSSSWVVRAKSFMSRRFREETEKKQSLLQTEIQWVARRTQVKQDQQEQIRNQLQSLEKQYQSFADWYKKNPPGKQVLEAFYDEQRKLLDWHIYNVERQRQLVELERYKQEHGKISDITEKYNSYIVHGIDLTPGGINNIFLDRSAGWKSKLAIIVSEHPAISASMFPVGSGHQSLRSPLGVVMKEGIVNAAGIGDIASWVVSLTEKKSHWYPKTIAEYVARLDSASQEVSESWGYNEVILGFGSEPAAFFINLDGDGNTSFDDKGMRFKTPRGATKDSLWEAPFYRLDFSEIFKTAEFFGLQVVCIKDGTIYQSSFGENGLILGGTLSPKEITAIGTTIPSQNLPEIQRMAKSALKVPVTV